MLDPDAKATQGPIVFLFISGQFAALRLLVWIIDVGMILVVALIRAVGVYAGIDRQLWPLAAERQVVVAPRTGG